jgi:hypothetical protein
MNLLDEACLDKDYVKWFLILESRIRRHREPNTLQFLQD